MESELASQSDNGSTSDAIEVALSKLSDGDIGAFGTLFKRKERALLNFATRKLSQNGIVEDPWQVIQKSAMYVIRRIRRKGFDSTKGLNGFVRFFKNRITWVIKDYHRVKVTPLSGSVSASDQQDLKLGPALLCDRNEAISIVNQELPELDEELRIVLVLRLHEGMKLKDIATRLNENEGTIRRRFATAKQRLRKLICLRYPEWVQDNWPIEHELHTAAHRYARLGYRVFPCKSGGCEPIIANPTTRATTDSNQIYRWWTEHRDHNIALLTDGLVVIELDGVANPRIDHERDLESVRAAIVTMPDSHKYWIFRQPNGTSWRSCQVGGTQPIKIQADGGYIIVPPSRQSGKLLHWSGGRELDGCPQQLTEPPSWLVDLIEDQGQSANNQRT